MVYPSDFENKIGFDRIREILTGYCLSNLGSDKISGISFATNREVISRMITLVDEFQKILLIEEPFPADNYYDLTACLNKIKVAGTYPELSDLFDLKRTLATLKQIYNYVSKINSEKKKYPGLFEIVSHIRIYPFVSDSIDRILNKEGNIRDNASPGLAEIRSDIKRLTASVSKKLQSVLRQSQKDGFIDKNVTVAIRNGRGVVPVGAYEKNRIKGLVHDQSATGKTVYIEPAEVVAMNNQIVELEYDEKREIIKILTQFADSIRPYIDELLMNFEILGDIDMIRAKAILGNRLKSTAPGISESDEMEWKEAYHPLLKLAYEPTGREVVPLTINLSRKTRILLISGPNAGGKSVCLKTVGLLQYMFQCGLTIPLKEESQMILFRSIFIDIGDEQSIENDLSTYSSHLVNMKYYLKNADERSMVLIDEFGTGTEPMLGGAIAEAILARLNELKVFGVLTTHYTNLKHYASSVDGIVNGAMMYDNHRMQPLFRLEPGKPGSSFAFEIARKIGLPEDILKHASDTIGEDHINFDRHLKDIVRDKRYWERRRQDIRVQGNRLEELIASYEESLGSIKNDRKTIIEKARQEAGEILGEANRQVEKTIKEIRESQAEKTKTKEARKELVNMGKRLSEDPEEEKTVNEKIARLREKEKRIRSKSRIPKPDAVKRILVKEIKDKPLEKGDYVVMEGSSAAGEVIEIKGKKAKVAFGNIITSVDVSLLKRV
ncbi:MAG: endonuclease MutS2, partial [Bacteroidales bacterium]|nr:endonuclease MutS2 [Bacteroidales bacterium]